MPCQLRRLAVLAILNAIPAIVTGQNRSAGLPTVPVAPRITQENGVRVMRHDSISFRKTAQLTLAATPIATIGGSDGDPDFDLTYVGSAALLSDGRLAAYSSIGTKLMLFKANGEAERRIGRQGKGPGEFASVSNMFALPGDTLFLLDRSNSRLNWVLPDRGVVRDEPRGTQNRLRFESVVGTLPGGRFVITSAGLVQDGEPDKIVRPTSPIAVLSPNEGMSVKEVARIPDLELKRIRTNYRGQSGFEDLPIRFTRHAIAGTWGSSIVTSSGEGYALDIRSPDGTITSRLSVAIPRKKVTKAMIDATVEREIKALLRPGPERPVDAKESERQIREAPVADSLPPFQGIFTTSSNTLWIVDAIAPGKKGFSATAFRPDGAMIGRLKYEGDGYPIAFGNDRVVLLTADDDDVVALVVRRIVAGPSTPASR